MIQPIWVTANLAIGPAPLEQDYVYLKNQKVEAIIDVRCEYCDDQNKMKELGLKFLHISVDDRYCPTKEQLDKVFEFVNPLLDKNKKIYIHCQNGYGRSPLVAITILVKRGMDTAEALYLMEDKHPTVSFSQQQEKFVHSVLSNLK